MSQPQHVCILTAMPDEAAPFIAQLTDARPIETPFAAVEAVSGTFANRPATIVTTGIGLAAAASAATWAVVSHAPELVISAGTCGGLAVATNVGDIAVADAASYGTADATEFGYARGQVPGQPLRFATDAQLVNAARAIAERNPRWHVGRILSGDTFVTARNVADMREAFADAVAADMETCAIAQVCASLSVPFISVRGISDLCGPAAGQDFHIGVDIAAANSRDAVAQLLSA